jgi:hypothetical protein
LFQLVPANYCLSLCAHSADKEAISECLKTHLDLNKLVVEYPYVPLFSDVIKYDESKYDPDPRDEDEELHSCEIFKNHMLWVFGRLEEQKCNTLGRIYLFGGKIILKILVLIVGMVTQKVIKFFLKSIKS